MSIQGIPIGRGRTVEDLFQANIAAIMNLNSSGVSFIDSLNMVMGILFRRLMFNKSDFAQEKITLSYPASRNVAELQALHMGIVKKPFMTSPEKRELEPFGERNEHELYGGNPRYYELRQFSLAIYPVVTVAVTVETTVWKAPGKIISMTDYLPYNSFFDDVIREVMLRVLNTGSAVNTDPALELFLNESVDHVLSLRSYPLPAVRTSRRSFF